MRRSLTLAAVGAALVALTGCGSDGGSDSSASLSTEHSGSEFCTTFAALDSSSVFLHAGEDAVRPGLELQIERLEQMRSTLPTELADIEPSLGTRVAAAQATLDIYAANDFDVDAVTADPTYDDVSKMIGASLHADVIDATRDTREYCGIEL